MTLYLGTTPIANTGYDKANISLSNLTSTGKNIANWSSNVSNCITEIPQDIKLELNNGTLTLKAGSKVYVPNGFESDGTTLKFDVVMVENDISKDNFNIDGTFMLWVGKSALAFGWRSPSDTGSGNSTSSFSGLYYRTDLNKIFYNNDTSRELESFPICIFTTANSGFPISIDQVFNGFGYIGSTVFALPNVKGLIPKGRNADGSLNNIEFVNNSVEVITRTWNRLAGEDQFVAWFPENTPNSIWYYNKFIVSNTRPTISNYTFWYDPETNIMYYGNGSDWVECEACTPLLYCGSDGTTKVNGIYNVKQVFHALDYNDKSTIIDWSMLDYSAVIDVTSSLYSNKYYTAPKRGVLFNAMLPKQNSPIQINGHTIGIRRYSTYGNWIPTPYPMQNGDTFSVTGWTGSEGGAYFVPLKGAN